MEFTTVVSWSVKRYCFFLVIDCMWLLIVCTYSTFKKTVFVLLLFFVQIVLGTFVLVQRLDRATDTEPMDRILL